MKKFYILTIILFFVVNVFSQIKGVVIDTSINKPIERLVVGIAIKGINADTNFTITDAKGQFVFDIKPDSLFSIFIINKKYKSTSRLIKNTSQAKEINTGTFKLYPVSQVLTDVVVTVHLFKLKKIL